jgi:mannose-6-phosphate isomerase-like protein (cupin superfamily)
VPTADDDVLTVRRELAPHSAWTPEHVHLGFSERFEVLEGIADVRHAGKEMRLGAGKALYVGQGVWHANVRNRDNTKLVYKQTFTPATEGARSYVATLAQVLREGRDDDGELPWPVVLAIGDVTRERTYARRLPYVLQRRVLLPVGNFIAGTRDFDVHLARQRRKAAGASTK